MPIPLAQRLKQIKTRWLIECREWRGAEMEMAEDIAYLLRELEVAVRGAAGPSETEEYGVNGRFCGTCKVRMWCEHFRWCMSEHGPAELPVEAGRAPAEAREPTLDELRKAVEAYLAYLHGDEPLNDMFGYLKGAVITSACNLFPAVPAPAAIEMTQGDPCELCGRPRYRAGVRAVPRGENNENQVETRPALRPEVVASAADDSSGDVADRLADAKGVAAPDPGDAPPLDRVADPRPARAVPPEDKASR